MRIGPQTVVKAMLGVESLVRPGTRAVDRAPGVVLVLEFMLPLGCCVHMTPLYEAIKRGHPEGTLIVATRGLGLQVLRHSPFVDRLLDIPDPLTNLWSAAVSLRRQLKAIGLAPECCLTGVPDQRSKIALLAAMVCGGWRGGFTLLPSLYHRPLQVDRERSQIENNLRLAELTGCASGMLEPRVFFTAEEASKARSLLRGARNGDRPILAVVAANSGGQRTGWYERRWVETLRRASSELGLHPVFLGTSGDREKIEALRAKVGDGTSLAGETNIGELAAVMALSDLAISLDTGTMHVGRAVDVPMVVLGPSWQKPREWLPLGKANVRILRGEDRIGVPDGYQLDEIAAEAAFDALAELQPLYPASASAREDRVARCLSERDLLTG